MNKFRTKLYLIDKDTVCRNTQAYSNYTKEKGKTKLGHTGLWMRWE